MARDLVFEIGVEEIPSTPLYSATTQLKELAEKRLKSLRLEYEEVHAFGAPRRLVLFIEGLAERQDDLHQRLKGPSVKGAFGPDGAPTPAALGFARGKGVDVADLVRGEEAGGEYVYALIERVGSPSIEVLPDMLASVAADLQWPRSQRWGSGDTRFIRPVRWLLALLGTEVVPVAFAGLKAGRLTWGHRFLSANPIEVPDATSFFDALERGKVMLDGEQRAIFVREGVEAAAAGESATAVVPEKVFAEVVNLTEYPTVAVGHFDESFLRVPREVIETAMESHQRYFPLQDADGALTSGFVVVHNGDPDRTESIVRGHERVIRARLSDAAFFYDEDLRSSMEQWVERLSTITFQDRLGTLAAKTDRIEALAVELAGLAGVEPEHTGHALRAAHLCKADLVSHVVVEFPTLQGVMGRYYALAGGEDSEVADAVLEHYRPRFAGDALPDSLAGALVSAADKLDTICGIFAIGQAPTGSADPFALRRSAIGVLAMAIDGGLAITLDEAIASALDGLREVVTFDVQTTGASVKDFLVGRLEGMLRDRGHAYDTVDAVLAVAADDPADALARCVAFTEARASAAMTDLVTAFGRAKNLGDASLGGAWDRAIMNEAEAVLADAIEGEEGSVAAAVAEADYREALGLLAALRGPIDAFFEAVLVMDPDPELRCNRLRLLNRFVTLFEGVADFSRLQG